MVAKAILLILTTLYGCHSWNYDEQNCSTNKIFVNLKCLDSKQHSINIFLVDQTLHITHDNGLVDIDLETFPKLDLSHELRKANRKLIRIKMENCTLPNGYSFGILFEHLGIEDEILAFEGVNIARSLFLIDGRFSGGFEKLENLTLSGNSIRQLDEHVFQSLPKLFNLDLSHNEIVTVHKNVFKNMTELKQLKLSWNRLKSLSEGMFDHQKHLNVLSLHSNRLSYLTKDMFQGLDCLNVLTLEKNEFSGLTSDVFHNLPALLQISLGNSNMRVPYTIFAKQSHLQYVFLEKVNVNEGLHLSGLLMLQIKSSEVSSISGLSNIEKLSIISCKLNPSAITSFKNFSSTKELNLSSNKISNLENGLFDGMRELVQLQLSNNYLTNISRLDFQDLHNLNEIDLSDNRITTIHPKAFVNTTQLTTINLKNNQLWFNDSKTPFLHLYNLETLNLSNNSLERMPADLLNLEKLKEVDLSFNQIRLVKFSEIRQNFIKLNATYETRPSLGNRNTHINLKNNPLDCDCSMFEFLSGTDQGQLAPVFSDTCFKHAHHLRPCYRETYLSDECPTGCDCTEDKVNQFGIQISCKGNGLTRLPGIELIHATPFELDISNNSLTELPCLHTNAHVTFIQASFNRISQIEVDKLPGSLRGLDLSHNNIKTIAPYVIAYLQHHRSLEIILLKDNPFECRCSDDTEQLVKFASENGSITDFHEANCNENYALTADVLRDICDQEKTIYILSFLTVLTIISGLILILLFKHRKFIKIWLYANDWFLWWVDEEYVDRDKVYDIFISYADENKMLAYRITVALERSNVFRICLHERDFLGGERIEKSIHDAVYQSRRTLVILSESYVTSQWCEHEFHLAWARSVSERRNLIIALKAGDLENIADETIDSYIKSHTYIDANDQWFWERLIYRLPHKKTIKNILPIREYEIVEYEESENEEESV